MNLEILRKYRKEIRKQFNHALVIEKEIENKQLVHDAFISSIINMCIKYETLTSEMEEMVFKREPRYNHPWANTRIIAEKLGLDIKKEYKVAHDAWDLYNTLKHINDQMKIEQTKLFTRYNIKTIKEAAYFVKNSLLDLVDKFIKKPST